MSFEQRFTQSEQELLATTPILIGSAMAFAESSGLGTVKELFASAKTYASGLKSYPDNEIIQGILPNLEDRSQAREQAKAIREHAIARLKEEGIDSPEKMRTLLLNDSRAVAGLLALKATAEEAAQYREWAMAVAENVAKAAHEGGFLGFGGTQVSEAEKQLFGELAEALGSGAQLG
ncbi:MAG: hypothetical protein PVG38_14830 [Gammaproteobacteria bacterium]|jgi:hypothetical protein